MEVLFSALLETEWGYMLFGVMIIIAMIIIFFDRKPKI